MLLKVFRQVTLCLLLFTLVACGTLDAGVEPGDLNTPTPIPIVPTTDGGQPTAASETTASPIATASPLNIAPTATVVPTAVSSNTQITATPLPVRIQFVPGATSSTQTGTLPPHSSHEYVLYASAGQTMHINLATVNGKANFSLQGLSDGQPYKRVENGDRFWNSTLPLSQDYLIRVATPDSADSYTLEVTIDPLQPQPQRIVFAPGEVSASVSGTIEANTYDQYVLSAQAGQTMHVNLMSTNGFANFDLVGASDGQPYKRAIYQPAAWDGLVPMTQDYLINVSAPADTSDSYTLYVTVDPLPVPEPTPEWIQFPTGGTSATVSGTFAAGGDGSSFILDAQEGQTLTVQVTSNAVGAVSVFVKDETGRIVMAGTDEEPISLNLTNSGDYTIFLYTPGAAPAVNYTMVVTIP